MNDANAKRPARATYVIAYDVSCPRRLGRVARFLEKHATRVQKSVFILKGHAGEMRDVMASAARLVDENVDKLQVWRVHGESSCDDYSVGPLTPVEPAVVIASKNGFRWFSGRQHKST